MGKPRQNAVDGYAEFGNLSESRTELEKERNQLNMKMECCDKMRYFPELQGLQDKRKAIRRCVRRCKHVELRIAKMNTQRRSWKQEKHRRMHEQEMRQHAELEKKVNMLQRETVKEGQKEDVSMGEGEGQTSEKVGFGESLKKLRIKHVQGLLSSQESVQATKKTKYERWK